MSHKLIIAGGREFIDYDLLSETLHANYDVQDLVIVCGEARGADAMGRIFAEENNLEILSFPADWKTHGKAAGHIRNAEMGNVADALLAFWDGKSKGTKGMINYATKKGLAVEVVRYD